MNNCTIQCVLSANIQILNSPSVGTVLYNLNIHWPTEYPAMIKSIILSKFLGYIHRNITQHLVIISTGVGLSAREVVRILLGHNGSNRCETVICYLGAWEGKKVTSVKRNHTFSARVSRSLCGGGVSRSTVCTRWGPTYFWHLSCMMTWSQEVVPLVFL